MGNDQKQRTTGACIYCSRHDILTVDLVIPRCLFESKSPDDTMHHVPGDVPKVDVCRQCNNQKSIDDTFLRDVLVRDVRSAEHQIAADIRNGAHSRSISRGMSQYPRAASRLRYVPSPNGSGVWTAEPILPKDRLSVLFARLVRGLMVAYEGYTLSSATNIDVVRAVDSTWAIAEAARWAKHESESGSGMIHKQQAGDGSVIWCIYYHTHSEDQPNLSQWWLCFYERTMYVIVTDMSNLSLGSF